MDTLNLESFAYKGESKLFLSLADIIKKERQLGKASKTQLANSGILELIKEETGINITKISTELGKYGYAILTNNLSGKDINTTRHYIDQMTKEVIKNDAIFTIDNLSKKNEWYGAIDLKKHKVSGVFAKLQNTLYVDEKGIYGNDLPAEQIAAIICHEIGHAIYGFLTLAHIVTFSTVFQSINEQIKGITDEEVKFKLSDIGNHMKLDEEDLEAIVRSKTTADGYNVLLTSVAEKIKSTTNELDIDRTFNESYADIFVVRNGGGKHLFDALNTMFKEHNSGYRSKTMNNVVALAFNFVISLGLAGYMVLLSGAALAAVPYLAIIATVLLHGMAIISGTGGGDVYEDPKERLQRIKMDVLGELRQKISKERRTQLNEQLISMTKALTLINNDRVSYLEFLKSLNSSFRKYRVDQDRQRVLQEIGRNDLILASSMLKELA